MSESTQCGDMFLLLVLPWRPHLLIVVVLGNPPSLFWLLERPTLIVVVLGCQQIVEMGLHNGKSEEEPFEYEVEEEEGRKGPGEEDPLLFCSIESGE
ncbi:hypothetical protein Bca4012_054659 [Brassica carinata]|uniref:Uncharacterized protein n=1 Tax=Brassica carinata TaxID=52824 RepID=A0A8X7VYG1_BRACI|nr:hypothetical protein Bca52824_012293 [Brassica carinata]